jgi:hypothetical protein
MFVGMIAIFSYIFFLWNDSHFGYKQKFFKTKVALSYTHIFTLVQDALEAIG